MDSIDDLIRRILGYLRSSMRYKWQAVAGAWFLCVAGWVYVMLMPDQYEAEAQVYVNTDSTLRPLLEGLAIRTDVMSQVNLMTRAMLSRPQLEKVARETDLFLRAKTPEQKENLLEGLEKSISIESVGDNLFRISFSDRDREMAQKMVRTLLSRFVEDTLGEGRLDSNQAQSFIQEQITDYENRLKESEDRLAEFKKQNMGMMPDDRGDYFARLQTAHAGLAQTQALLNQARVRRQELARQLVGEEPVFGLMGRDSGMASSVYDGRIADYEKELDRLLIRFTDKHPEVLRVQEILDNLQEKKRVELSERAETNGPTPRIEGNEVYQSMRIAKSEVDVEVAALENRVRSEQRKVRELSALVDRVPEVEAELAQLNRDYAVTEISYQALLSRLESARISDDADQSRDGTKFKTIEPPFAKLEPVSPHRSVLLTVVLLVGLVGGLGLAFFLSRLNLVFADAEELRAVTGQKIIGAISAFPDAEAVKTQWYSRLACGFAYSALIVCYTVSIIFQDYGVRALARVLS